jgi:hypothetical protein
MQWDRCSTGNFGLVLNRLSSKDLLKGKTLQYTSPFPSTYAYLCNSIQLLLGVGHYRNAATAISSSLVLSRLYLNDLLTDASIPVSMAATEVMQQTSVAEATAYTCSDRPVL